MLGSTGGTAISLGAGALAELLMEVLTANVIHGQEQPEVNH